MGEFGNDTTTPTTTRVHHHCGVAVVEVTGEIDMACDQPIRAAVADQLDRRPAGLVLDLTRVDFFGSTGISTLISAHEMADERGKKLHVVAPQRAVRRPLQVTGVADVLALYDSVDEAVAALKPVPSE